jgi:hypothetical protein
MACRRPKLGGFLLVAVALMAAAPAALARGATRTVHYHGIRVTVPASWPVFDLASDPATCVRFNRHAVYLGAPSSEQRCPPAALGRTEAILLEPVSAAARVGAPTGPRPTAPEAGPREGSLAVLRRGGVRAVATWRSDPAIVRDALRAPGLGRPSARSGIGATPVRHAQRRVATRAAGRQAATTYTGLGFDACSAPSSSQLQSWSGASPFHAFGIYIGGTNMACSQSNLSSAYVSQEVAAGWHLIPTYVGLQAPGNGCGCAAISASSAAAQGTAAAQDAVSDAQALGIEAGNPIYFDMEAYGRTSKATATVLSFLGAWTAELHARGYLSGVYSSDNSGIADLVAAFGTGYLEPDELWNAAWNGQESTTDSVIPATDWASHQRIHQYRGAHNDKYGGVTLNIDTDYVDAATVGTGGVVVTPAGAPRLTVSPQPTGAIKLGASWSGVGGISGWRVLGGDSPGKLSPLTGTVPGRAVSSDAVAYFQAQAIGPGGQVMGATAVTPTPAHVALYGRSIFVPSRGFGGVPVGCYTETACSLRTTITAGHTVIARTGPERVAAYGGGIVHFGLSAEGRRLLARARYHRLPAQVNIVDASGVRASATMTMVPFSTSGRGPARASHPAATLGLMGLTDFVNSAGWGGILAECNQPAPCRVGARIVAGRTTIATTGREAIGAHELSYVAFHLSAAGKAMLARAPGNMLGATVTLSGSAATASGQIALVAFL